MLYDTPTLQLLARAIDVSALRQSVYAANIANAGVEGFRRMEVSFDGELARASLQMANAHGAALPQDPAFAHTRAAVVSTQAAVRLDEEVALMAKNALRYQLLLGAFERSMGTLRLAIHEGRE